MFTRTNLARGVVALILLLMVVLMVFSIRDDSPTSDEPPHILSGYVALKYGHDYIDTEHPLLAKTFAATPLLLQNLKVNLTDPNYQVQKHDLDIGKMFATSRQFMNYSGNNPDQILFLTRLPMIFLAAIFGVGVYLLAKKMFGELIAVVAVFLYATEPNILANGALFNTDMPATGFVLLTLLALTFYLDKQTLKRLTLLTLALAGAVLVKFSTFYFVPVVIALMLYFYRRQEHKSYKHILYLILGLLALISLFYGIISFRDQGWLGFVPIIYFKGLGMVFYSVSTDKRFAYLLGESYFGSRPQYFPILLLAKTQILTLIGFVSATALLYLNKFSTDKKYLLVTLAPMALYLVLAILSRFNIGIRHILPIYPVLLIFAAAGLVALFKLVAPKFNWKNISLSVLVGLIAVFGFRLWSVTSTYPHFLSYYNLAAGGTDSGWKIADDSNYDWGQDVKRLADFVRSNKINSLAFDNYTGLYAASGYYHLPVWQFNPSERNYKGYLALSTSAITYHQNQPQNYSWVVDNYRPIYRAGKSIFIFKLD